MCNILYLATGALLLLASPHSGTAGNSNPEDIPSENRFNFFDAELLQAVANSNTGNVLVSPVSIKAVLALILEGAGGTSGEQIRRALRLPENQEAIQTVFYKFLTSIQEPATGIKLEMATRVFMAKRLQPNHAYLTSLRQHYYSDLVKVDFNTPDTTARIINDWVKTITKGLIPKLIDADNLQPDSLAVITNAVYFKGRWKIPFDQEATNTKCFYRSSGVCFNTNMMETLEFFNYNYIRELDADAIEIPYEGNKFSMLLLAPKEIDGLAQLKRDIVHVPIHSIVASLEPTEVLVSLPRFEIDFSTDLVSTLHTLGIRDVFGPNANLTGMLARAEASAQISNVFHKAKIIVNEAGSEAAAGTGALVIPLMGSTISKFRADRPFLFFIRDMTTGITLFAGRVSQPEAASAQHRPATRPTPSPADIASIFNDKFVSTLRPSQSNSGGGGGGGGQQQNHRTTTRRSRPQTRPTVPTTTEGREISFSTLNNPSDSSNVHYPSTSQEKTLPYNPASQNKNSQYEGNTNNFNSPNQNPQYYQNQNRPAQSFPQNPNVQYSQSNYEQQNSQIIPQQQTSSSQTQSRPEFNRPSLQHQSPSITQLSAQNPSPSFTQNGNSNTYTPNFQSTDQQSNVRITNNQNPQFSSNTQNLGFKSQNSFPVRPIYNREMQQYPNNANGNAQFQSATLPVYLHYPIPGNTAEYLSNTRESQQASGQRTPTYSVVVKNETPLQAPGGQSSYQQPQSQDKDAILFTSQHTA